MKPYLPYNTLLIVAIAATGFMIFYNLTLRESFPVMIAYDIPASPKTAEEAASSAPDYPDYGGGEAAVSSVDFPLDINLATQEELMFIPRVGDVMSQRIIQYREHLGGYSNLEQLMEIKGIGESIFESISAYLIISAENTDYNGGRDITGDDQTGYSDE